jgi:hypothetical protein
MTTWGNYRGPISGFEFEKKAPQDILLDLPQEKFTGDVLKGRGPRRGNLERLLRYWRPIMKKSGGFTRCKAILADHPELYPLNNICAWLHHETTGLWPNEGCHHPDMKNCKKKMKKMSGWSDSEFGKRVVRKAKGNLGKKSDDMGEEDYDNVVTTEDEDFAAKVMMGFQEMESSFCKMLSDDSNWEQEGDTDGGVKSIPYNKRNLEG